MPHTRHPEAIPNPALKALRLFSTVAVLIIRAVSNPGVTVNKIIATKNGIKSSSILFVSNRKLVIIG